MDEGTARANPIVYSADPAWYRATTLTERISSLQTSEGRVDFTETESASAQQRVERWRSESVFNDDDSRFTERLAMDGISEHRLRQLLNDSAEATRDRFTESPEWLDKLDQAFSEYVCSKSPTVPEQSSDSNVAGFLCIIEPLILWGRGRVRREIERLSSKGGAQPFSTDGLEELLLADLRDQLFIKLGRTMVLELNVARIEGSLEGDTPEERFQSFTEHLSNTEVALKILKEYPVLARQLVVCVDQWVEISLEFAKRLSGDWEQIRGKFCPEEDPGELVKLEGGVGDRHRGGRSVYILGFESGFRLVYKPRSLAVDVHFQELLIWLNERGDHPPFRILSVLDQYTHGWVEYLEAHGCQSSAELERFYRRQGGYLALLYAVYATDFHHENLIAYGEHPVLVDLESLLHPVVQEEDNNTEATTLAMDALNQSVLGIGLLPQRIWANDKEEGVDISGLGGAPGQMTPHRLPYWENNGTDEMHLARERIEMPGSNNRPTLQGSEVDVLAYKEEVISGFSEVYQLLHLYSDELVSEYGPLARFASDEVRYIARPTRTYAMRLYESFHPDLLRDALDRDRFFDGLWVSGEAASDIWSVDRRLARIFPYEREDLQRGDIPMFTTRPNSRHLWSTSNQPITNYFGDSALTLAFQRLQGLSEEDLEKQTWIIRASFAALTLGEGRTQWPQYNWSESHREANQRELLAAASEIGDRLELLALGGDKDTSWITLTLVNDQIWSLLPAGMDLYNGLSGIALFLGYLGDMTGEQRYTKLAKRAVESIRFQWKQIHSSYEELGSRDSPLTIGAFGPLGGTIYTLTHLGKLWDEPEMLNEAEEFAEFLIPLVDQDENFDLLSGAAGCIEVLLTLHSQRPFSCALRLATQCGDHLLAHAQHMAQGIGWPTPTDQKPLLGFSHGAAGIAHALLNLATATNEQRFREAAFEAIAYERSLFSPEVENWPDLREEQQEEPGHTAASDDEVYMTAWCHGAPGIGLARLDALRHVDDSEILAEIKVALKKTLEKGFGLNHSLCHGALGNLELLLEIGLSLNDQDTLSRSYRIAVGILQSINERGCLSGVPSEAETPGLMMGISGVGYGLLRLADPERVPSVLKLETPVPYDD